MAPQRGTVPRRPCEGSGVGMAFCGSGVRWRRLLPGRSTVRHRFARLGCGSTPLPPGPMPSRLPALRAPSPGSDRACLFGHLARALQAAKPQLRPLSLQPNPAPRYLPGADSAGDGGGLAAPGIARGRPRHAGTGGGFAPPSRRNLDWPRVSFGLGFGLHPARGRPVTALRRGARWHGLETVQRKAGGFGDLGDL